MKIYENKSIFKKIVIFLIIILISSFCFSGNVQAKDDTKGGKLLNPISDLLVFAGDGIMNVVHTVLYKQHDTTVTVDTTRSVIKTVLTIAVGFLVAAVAAVLVVVSAGGIVAAAAAAGVTLSAIGAGTVLMVAATSGVVAAAVFNSNAMPDVIEIPVYQISPDRIFSNDVLMFDVDFFNPKKKQKATDLKGEEIKNSDGSYVYLESTAAQLRSTISNWYTILRDIAIVSLLSILVYVGIRILISSASKDKAKYKQMLIDWVVAICLLFFMQYIMSFSNLLVGKITDVVKSTRNSEVYVTEIADKNGKVEEKLKELGYDDFKVEEMEEESGKKVNYVEWPTNILGYARLTAQMSKKESASYAGYSIIFVILVLFTVYFIITYLKRVVYMAFLTLIAPLVAMTYPIDKMNDGKAQAFDMWFKEYIFNLLIQPMHLILFTVLVSSAYELAKTNIIYSLAALGFMMPAEKLLRKFFGFEKAQTPGLLAGPAGAAMMMNGMNRLLGKGPKGHGGPSSGKGGSEPESPFGGSAPRVNSAFDKIGALFGKGNNKANGSGSSGEYEGVNEGNDNPVGLPGVGNSTGGDYNDGMNAPINSAVNSPINSAVNSPINSAVNSPINTDIGNGSQTQSMFNTSNYGNSLNNSQSGGRFKRTIRRGKNTAIAMAKGARRGAMPIARYYGRGMKRQLKNAVKNMHPVKNATKFAAGAAGAATLGAAGLAVGVTSGDLSKVAQYAGGAALGGYKLNTGIKEGLDTKFTPAGIDDVAKRAAYENDEEYEKAQQQKYIREYQKNEKNRFELERKYDKKQADEIMANDIPEFLNNGVTDMNDITTILEMRDNKDIRNIDEGIAVKKYASRIGSDTTKMKKKDRDEWQKTFANEFGKKEQYKDYDHNNMADTVMNKIDSFNKIKYNK